MSLRMTGSQPSSRYLVSSELTRASSIGIVPGMISRFWSPRCHNTEITVAMSRSTPRVRWNRSKVDQAPNNWSKSSGWIG